MEVPIFDSNKAQRLRRWERGLLFLAVACALLLSAWLLLPQTVGEHLRASIVAQLQQQYPQFDVSLRRVTIDPSIGIILEDLRLSQDVGDQPREVQIARLVCEAEVDFERILEAPIRPRRILVSGAAIAAGPLADGRWPLLDLWPTRKVGTQCPQVLIRDAQLRVVSEPGSSLEFHGINGKITSVDGARRIELSGRSLFAARAALAGKVDDAGDITAAFQIENARWDRELLRCVPQRYVRDLAHLQNFSGNVSASGQIVVQRGAAPDYAIRVAVNGGRLADPQISRPLESMKGSLMIYPHGVEIETATADFGPTRGHLSGSIHFTDEAPDVSLSLQLQGLELADVASLTLPDALRRFADHYHPRGTIDVQGQLSGPLTKPRFQGACSLNGVSVLNERFPYPVNDISGVVKLTDQSVEAKRLVGRVGGQRATAAFSTATDGAWQLQIAADGPIPIDATLLSALSPRGAERTSAETFLRSLDPAGSLQILDATIQRRSNGEIDYRATLDILGGSLRWTGFPYPLSDVRGRVIATTEGVQLENFRGQSNDAAVVTCSGMWYSEAPPAAPQLDLRFTGFAIPLDNTLRAALTRSMRKQWDALAPSGTLDRLDIGIQKEDSGSETRLSVAASQYDAEGLQRHTVTLRPSAIPYTLEIVRGQLALVDDHIQIDRIDARHGSTWLSAKGRCRKLNNDDWHLFLEVLPPSRIWADADLLAALPVAPRDALREIDLKGPIGVRGTTNVMLAGSTSAPASDHGAPFDWDLLLQLEGNGLGDSSIVSNLRGEIAVAGAKREGVMTAAGDVAFDSVHVLGVQLTSLRGDFSVQNGLVSFGRAAATGADAVDGTEPRLVGQLFGGELEVDGTVDVGESDRPFDVALSLEEATLAEVLAEVSKQSSNAAGTCGGSLRVRGAMNRWRNATGRGNAYLREAKMYQTPQIVQLLNLLRINPTEDTAFTTGDFQFRVDGDRLAFDSIELSGDLIALHGGGTVNDRKEVDLAFETRVSPKSAWYHFVLPLQSDRYNLYGIRVTGPIDNPQLERRAMPQIEEALQRLLPAPPIGPAAGTQPDTARTPSGVRRRM